MQFVAPARMRTVLLAKQLLYRIIQNSGHPHVGSRLAPQHQNRRAPLPFRPIIPALYRGHAVMGRLAACRVSPTPFSKLI